MNDLNAKLFHICKKNFSNVRISLLYASNVMSQVVLAFQIERHPQNTIPDQYDLPCQRMIVRLKIFFEVWETSSNVYILGGRFTFVIIYIYIYVCV